MANQELVNYINKCIAQGYDENSVRQTLLNSGWQPADVDDAFYFVQQDGNYAVSKPAAAAKPAPKRPRGVAIISIIGIILAILLILGSAIAFIVTPIMGAVLESSGIPASQLQGQLAAFGVYMTILGMVMLILGATELIAFIFLLKMKRRGMIMVLITEAVSIAISIFITKPNRYDAMIISWVLPAVIIAYVFMKRKLFV